MKFFIPFIVFALILIGCGADSNHFKLEGRFANLNQGEFYIYSPDGVIDGIDTIKIKDSRFAYEIPIDGEATLIMVFPNFSEQPVFAEPGATVTVKADASHLKEMEITGTDDNKLMTKLRMNINKANPPEEPKIVEQFIRDNSSTNVGRYLINKYFILSPNPDYNKAEELTGLMMQQQDNVKLTRLHKQIESLKALTGSLQRFEAKDINNVIVSNTNLNKEINIINTWASWNYTSQEIMRMLKQLRDKNKNRMAIVSIALNEDRTELENSIRYDSINWPIVCDGKLWNGPLIKTLGLSAVPQVIIANRNGKIIGSYQNREQIREKLEAILK